MKLLRFDPELCTLCGACIDKCPFEAITMEKKGITLNENCRMCGVCVRQCQSKALYFEQKAGGEDKSTWNGILVYAEQERGKVHPVVFELIGEARKLAKKVGYKVYAVMVGGAGTAENAKELLTYGVDEVFVYEHEGFNGFKADCYADAVADCISKLRPSVVLVGGTSLGRSLAPRLSTRFHTGLTADCTKLEMKANTDLVQIRPAFGGNIMAQIVISESRPQFATVRYKVMDRAQKVEKVSGKITMCNVTEDMVRSRIEVLSAKVLEHVRSIEEEDVLVVAGRGADKALDELKELAELLGGQLCFTRPMIEDGYGDTAHQIGLSGRTVKPKLILTFGVSGAIQFTACMNSAECIVAVNNDPEAPIFDIAHIAIKDDLYTVLPELVKNVKNRKDGE
ncbi:electron transfer flavoprotein subunit alpha [Clostridium sp. AM42-4]|uniref:electron transfer flavoprotein subunit alpha n=1 Tax=Clostridium sp. AM42-4 TaxID=2292305 RepID=UPI000E4BC228|nr:electron transfer flavoprotein subunit alpha [Clostridium sp. AM42-4]RHS82895.1 4Fe-4S dicluster domain-containing protein [Clostridium sp. AM42-4]